METIVPGDPEYHGTCISDTANRHDASHCWFRARNHIFRMNGFHFFEKIEAANACSAMVEVILKNPRPPVQWGVKWGWGKGWPEKIS